jgi:hypothetical protein
LHFRDRFCPSIFKIFLIVFGQLMEIWLASPLILMNFLPSVNGVTTIGVNGLAYSTFD